MELMEVLKNRRAVRDFKDIPVDRGTIKRLIHAAILAPSAMNLQPWAFAVRLGRDDVHRLGARAKEHLLKNFPDAGPEASLRKMVEDPNFVLFHHAPALVSVLAKSADSQAKEDCCLAAQNLMLAARDEGIGSCWIGFARPWLNLAATKAEFGIPPQYEFVAPIILGYPKSWPETHGRNAAEIFWTK